MHIHAHPNTHTYLNTETGPLCPPYVSGVEGTQTITLLKNLSSPPCFPSPLCHPPPTSPPLVILLPVGSFHPKFRPPAPHFVQSTPHPQFGASFPL